MEKASLGLDTVFSDDEIARRLALMTQDHHVAAPAPAVPGASNGALLLPCGTCLKWLPHSQFTHTQLKKQLRRTCKPCVQESTALWQSQAAAKHAGDGPKTLKSSLKKMQKRSRNAVRHGCSPSGHVCH